MNENRQRCNKKGSLGESMFAQEIFDRFNFQAQDTPHKHPFDFHINNVRVEVKFTTFTTGAYRANLREHTSADFDILVIILCEDEMMFNPVWIIAPMTEVTQKHVKISDRLGAGKFEQYRNNWQLLEQAIKGE